jgi:Xaa-Pro aminopeptidase
MGVEEMEYTPEGELKSRIRRFQDLLRGQGVDAALICQNVDLFYFAGTVQESFLFIPQEGEPILMVKKSWARAMRESALSTIEPLEKVRHIPGVLRDAGFGRIGTIGLELDVLPAHVYSYVQSLFPRFQFADISRLILKTRSLKSDYEIRQIRKAAEITDEVMSWAKEVIREGMTELEIDGLLFSYARKRGHQGRLRIRGWNQEMFHGHILSGKEAAYTSFCTSPVCGEGPNPAIAQGAGAHRVKRGEPIYIDFGVGINGYVSDETRTFCIGEPADLFLKGFEALLEIKRDMERNAGPGTSGRGIYRRAVELARARGFEDYFMGYGEGKVPFVGHGIGLEIDELPLLGMGVNTRLEEGMVYAFEPKLVFPDKGVMGVEDLYLVRSNGVERLTLSGDELIILPG